jgi:hypothetical protein
MILERKAGVISRVVRQPPGAHIPRYVAWQLHRRITRVSARVVIFNDLQ